MIISIHQPQYIPWFPYFKKILNSDSFVFLDDVQYQKNGIINRNQILNKNGKFWLTVPVINPNKKKIKEVKIDYSNNWIKKHTKSFEENYKKTTNFDFFVKYIQPVYNKKYENLADLNIEIISIILKKFFNKKIIIERQKNLNTKETSSNLIIEICKKMNATSYISGPGGKDYLNIRDFATNNIKLKFMTSKIPDKYPQINNKDYKGDISIMDFILNVGDNYKKYVKL